ncbi:MAG: molybdopterin-dependent oxidoreductase [Actinobacteria bacterium]|nr:molybdopterin-dependent oxidoreductase [Actinomycetota bacterium]
MSPSHLDRIPPGQNLVADFPVLHAGSVAHLRRESWVLNITGHVAKPLAIDWNALLSSPAVEQTCDLHCVTGWTKLDTRWKGVRLRTLLEEAAVEADTQHSVITAPDGWTTNLPVSELLRQDVIVAYEYEGGPISAEHGGPVRLLVPRLYLWKSAKWLLGIDLTVEQRLGFWETRGYHELGDPWLEQRYS